MQNSVFYEAFLGSAGVTKYSLCMGSHVARDITIPWTVHRMVRLSTFFSFKRICFLNGLHGNHNLTGCRILLNEKCLLLTTKLKSSLSSRRCIVKEEIF